jgi:transmembrane sensor
MWTPSDTLLVRYIAGECSDDETREVERWAGESPAHHARLEELRAIWTARPLGRRWDVPAIWTNVQRTMRADRPRARFRGFPSWQHAPRRLIAQAAIAATLLLAVGTSVVILQHLTRPPAAPAPESMREYATPRGQRATLQLPDGTRLTLAPASRLRIPATFGRGVREVHLDGEALFDVAHDSTRPFRVRAKDAVAEDLGTRFDVRAYAEDSVVAVAVAEGAVALGQAGSAPDRSDTVLTAAAQGVVLQEGELGTLGPDGQVGTTRGAALAGYLTWADGRLAIVDLPLSEAAVRLGRWYDVEVRLGSPAIATRRLTATFVHESPAEALGFVATILGLELTQAGRSYTLDPK